jgi:hypothetical protein
VVSINAARPPALLVILAVSPIAPPTSGNETLRHVRSAAK